MPITAQPQFSGQTANQVVKLPTTDGQMEAAIKAELRSTNSDSETSPSTAARNLIVRLNNNGTPLSSEQENKMKAVAVKLDSVQTTLVKNVQDNIANHQKLLAELTVAQNNLQSQIASLRTGHPTEPSKTTVMQTQADQIEKNQLNPLQKHIGIVTAQIADTEAARDKVFDQAQNGRGLIANPEHSDGKKNIADLEKCRNAMANTFNQSHNRQYKQAGAILANGTVDTTILHQLKADHKGVASEKIYDQLIETTDELNGALSQLATIKAQLAKPNLTAEEKDGLHKQALYIFELNVALANRLSDDEGRELLKLHATQQNQQERLNAYTKQLQALQKAAHDVLPHNYPASAPVPKKFRVPELFGDPGNISMVRINARAEGRAATMGATYECYEYNWVPKDHNFPNKEGQYVQTKIDPPLNPTGEDIRTVMAKWNGPEGRKRFDELKRVGKIPSHVTYEKITWEKDGTLKCGFRDIRDLIKGDLEKAQQLREARAAAITTSNVAAATTTAQPAAAPTVPMIAAGSNNPAAGTGGSTSTTAKTPGTGSST